MKASTCPKGESAEAKASRGAATATGRMIWPTGGLYVGERAHRARLSAETYPELKGVTYVGERRDGERSAPRGELEAQIHQSCSGEDTKMAADAEGRTEEEGVRHPPGQSVQRAR